MNIGFVEQAGGGWRSITSRLTLLQADLAQRERLNQGVDVMLKKL